MGLSCVYAEHWSKLQASLKLAIFWNRRATLTSSGKGANWRNTKEEFLTLELSVRTSKGLKALEKSIKMNDTWIRKSKQEERWPRKMKETGDGIKESVPRACRLSTLRLDMVVSELGIVWKMKNCKQNIIRQVTKSLLRNLNPTQIPHNSSF